MRPVIYFGASRYSTPDRYSGTPEVERLDKWITINPLRIEVIAAAT